MVNGPEVFNLFRRMFFFNLQGVCSLLPKCEKCMLLQSCNWSIQKNSLLENDSTEAWIQKARWDKLNNDELTEWLLEDQKFSESWIKIMGETEFRLKSNEEIKLLEWIQHDPGSKTPLSLRVLFEL